MTSDSPAASAAAEQVASVLQAAEQAAAQLRLEAEQCLRHSAPAQAVPERPASMH